jgi:two-component system nitrate/nitrite response regulator NarL
MVAEFDVSSVLIDLGDPTGEEALRRVRYDVPGICILALAVDDSVPGEVLACARLGCHGIVPRDAALEDVVRIIGAAEHGEVRIRPEIGGQIMRAIAEPAARAEITDCLTRREREICSLVAEGLTNKEIAREVNRSVGTVKNHVRSILNKLELPRRAAVSAYLHQTRITGFRR